MNLHRVGLLLPIFVLKAFAAASPAQAVQVTIGGNLYEVSLAVAGSSYFSNRDEIILSPWWGDIALSVEAATNFHAASGADYGITGGPDFVSFAYVESGPLNTDQILTHVVFESTGAISGPDLVGSGDALPANYAYAFAVPVAAVPEIDGNALAKALFILFALGAWLHTRRARAA